MRIPKEDRAGLYITVIVHLAAIIILLVCQLGFALRKENTFVLDFTKMEELEKAQAEIERLQKEDELQQSISEKLEQELGTPVRNVAVDRGSLKDDRGTDADQLYKDAERLSKELNSGFKVDDDDVAQVSEKSPEKAEKSESKYTGPSVVSWTLTDRKASRLAIPAYRCMGAGEVKVIITVDRQGTVIAAVVDKSCSSSDGCLQSYAIRAARTSKFSASVNAPVKQTGDIVYQFIAQ